MFFARTVGKPGRIVTVALAAFATVGNGLTWYTVSIPLPPLPLVKYSALLKIARPRKLLSLPSLSAA